jgi:hypothetical protein
MTANMITAFAFGVVFVATILIMAIWIKSPTPFQYTVFRIILAVAAAGVAAVIPGILSVTVSNYVQAGGALGVFVVIYFFAPAVMPKG